MIGEIAPRLKGFGFINTKGTLVLNPTPALANAASNTGATLQINARANQRNLILKAASGSGNLLDGQNSAGSQVMYIGSSGQIYTASTLQVNSASYLYGGLYSYGVFYAFAQAYFQSQAYFNSSIHGNSVLVTADYNVGSSEMYLLVDASAGSAQCTGSPSTSSCSSYGDESACNANDGHGGCTWNAGSSCSEFNGDSFTCSGTSGCSYPGNLGDCSVFNGDEFGCSGTSGCSWDSADCSGISDEATCGSTGGCTQNYSDCSAFDADEGTCGSTSGCTQNYVDCGSFFDEGSCISDPHCSWNGSSCDGGNHFHNCSGMYFTSCSGTYYPGTCSGNYDDGTCTGTYGAGCEGTPSCSGINDSTSCGAETGCAWTTGISINLGSQTTGRTLWIKKIDSSGNAVNIIPYLAAGHTIELAGSLSLSAQHKATMIQFYTRTYDCSLYNGIDQSTCETGHSGCTWTDNSCSGYGDQSSCESAGCYWNGSACAGLCSGIYYTYNWYEMSARRGV